MDSGNSVVVKKMPEWKPLLPPLSLCSPLGNKAQLLTDKQGQGKKSSISG